MAMSVLEAEVLCDLAARAKRVLMVDHTYLFSDGMRAVKSLIEHGELGAIESINSVRANLISGRSDVNLLWDLAPHDLSIFEELMPGECLATETRIVAIGDSNGPSQIHFDLWYAIGRVAHVDLSWSAPSKSRLVTIKDSHNVVIWDDLHPLEKVVFRKPGAEPTTLRIPTPRESLSAVVDHFGAVLAGRISSRMDGNHGLRVVRTLEKLQGQLDRLLTHQTENRR